MEIHISDRTHEFQSKTRLDAKANSELQGADDKLGQFLDQGI